MAIGTITSYIVENDRAFSAALKDAAKKGTDLRVALTLIRDDWRKANKAQFNLVGEGQYPPLSAKYAERKAIKHPGAPILVATGRLRDSLTIRGGTVDSISQIGKLSMILGTKVPYGIFHQSDGPRDRLPLRKFLFIGPEGRTRGDGTRGKLERWVAIIGAEMERQLKTVSTK